MLTVEEPYAAAPMERYDVAAQSKQGHDEFGVIAASFSSRLTFAQHKTACPARVHDVCKNFAYISIG